MAHGLIHSTRSIDLGSTAATNVTITVQPSASPVSGVALTVQPVLQLRDVLGNAVAQAGVTVMAGIITSGTSTLGGTTSVVTDANGAAAFHTLSVIGNAGAVSTIAFRSGGLPDIYSSAVTIVGSAGTHLGITTQPSTTIVTGVAFSTQPVIQILDDSNNPFHQPSVTITAVKGSGSATLGGTLTAITNSLGVATFTDLMFTGAPGDVETIVFSATGLTAATSNPINIVGVSDLNAPSYTVYVPRPHPADVQADAAANGFTLAALPQNFLFTKYGYDIDGTALGSFHIDTSCVSAGDQGLFTNTNNLQSAVAAANVRAQNTKIMLPNPFPMAGVTFTQTTSGNYWIYIEASTLPCAEGVRATPALFAGLNPPSIELNYDGGGFTCVFNDSSHRFRFIGIQWRTNDALMGGGALCDLQPYPSGQLGANWDWSTVKVDRVCIDRCWLRGGDRGVGQVAFQLTSNGVRLTGSNHAVVDSTVDGISRGGLNGGNGNEDHGIYVDACETFKIDNNYVEATSIPVFLGALSGGLYNLHRPTDGVIRRNFFNRPAAWITGLPEWDGGSGRTIKNGYEMKGGERILLEGNVTRRVNVQGGQDGQAFGVKTATGGVTADINGDGISRIFTRDVTIRWNDVADVSMFLEMQGVNDYPFAPNPIPQGFIDATCVTRLSFYHNRGDRVGPWDGVRRSMYYIETVHHHVYIGWNTCVPFSDAIGNVGIFNCIYTGVSAYESPTGLVRADHFNVLNNIMSFEYVNCDNSNSIWPPGLGDAALSIHTAGSYHWSGNGVINPEVAIFGNPQNGNTDTPNGTIIPQVATVAAVGFVNAAARNYRLLSSSPLYQKAASNANPGCDNDTVDLATTGVGSL